jgi:hypothetical protein
VVTPFCPEIQVRNVHNRRDLGVSFAEFMDHLESTGPYASPYGRLFDIFLFMDVLNVPQKPSDGMPRIWTVRANGEAG